MNKPKRKRKLVVGSSKWCEQKAQEKALREVFRDSWKRAIREVYGEEATEMLEGRAE